MFVGYLLVCIGLECKGYVQGFNTLEECEKLAAVVELNLPLSNPDITSVQTVCEAAGIDA